MVRMGWIYPDPQPLILLVRLLVKWSRLSILRMTIVALTGVAIVSLWLHYADSIIAGGPMMMGGKLGLWLSGKCEEWTGSRRISFYQQTLCPGDCEREDC